jgi:xylulose-5-phosphate/fructose-6-phosphate phosphoketolase
MKSLLKNIDYHFRAANYLSVAQLFLRDNVLLERKLRFSDLKSPVLGHWGTCPGVNFFYTHFCRYIQITKSPSYLILGLGHAAPALIANLYLERSLGEIYPDLDWGKEGLQNLISQFGIDSRLQTEISPLLPGVIYMGGELGHSLAFAVGSVLNNPKITSFCVIGDGEFESGSIMPSLFCREFLNPKQDGFLILAINLNQYKMSSRSLLSTWNDKKIESFFSSFNIKAIFCDLSHSQGVKIFSFLARMYKKWINGVNIKIPVIILKSQKGITGPMQIDGKKFVGTHYSHKVGSLKHPTSKHVAIIEKWLKSYKPQELFKKNGFPVKGIENNLPPKNLRIGKVWKKNLDVEKPPSFRRRVNEIIKKEGKLGLVLSPMEVIANSLDRVKQHYKKFMLFSPDEAESNKLGEFIQKHGIRGKPNWRSSVLVQRNGGTIEILNESCCHGMLQGYIQTNRNGVYVTFEAFAPITSSLISQYYKFLKIANLCKWRPKVPSLKYILTSLGWRNTYTHQNPDLLNTLLSKSDELIDVYFPSDPNQALASLFEMFKKKNSIQVLVVGKTDFPVLRSLNQAFKDVEKGFWIKNYGLLKTPPKLYIIAIGDYMVKEVISACNEINHRYKDLSIKAIIPICSRIFYKENSLKRMFDYENDPKNVIVVCTGYPDIFKGLFGKVYNTKNWKFLGYKDNFSLKRSVSVLELNEVNKESLIKYIKNQLPLS